MTINRDDEENVRKSVKKIEERIKFYEKSYAIQDRQDLLAMCALQLCVKIEKSSLLKTDSKQKIIEDILEIKKSISHLI